MSNTSSNFGFTDGEERAGPDRQMTYIAAISEALREEMQRDENVLVMGEDIGGDFGGAFKVTKGFTQEFGEARVMNMPMAELGFVGAATGMALMGLRPVVEMQFADFISTAFDSIVQYAATTHYRWQAAVPWVIRAPSDGGIRSGPFHSQNPEAWFVHTPGLKVVAPATPADAKGLLLASIRDNNPVIYLESKPLYRSLKGYVPEGDEIVLTKRSSGKQGLALAQAALDAGADVTLVSTVQNRDLLPEGIETIHVETALEMTDAVLEACTKADVLLMAAAVADFRPAAVAEQKIKKAAGLPTIELASNPDILKAVAEQRKVSGLPKVVVGFAAETQDLLDHAQRKLTAKGLDMIVANDVTAQDAGFAVDTNRVTLLYSHGGSEQLPLISKSAVAEEIIQRINSLRG